MSVRAKFKVVAVTLREGGAHDVKLVPVAGGSLENEAFFKWTPYGEINMGTLNEEAGAQFKPGAEFYVDFMPAN